MQVLILYLSRDGQTKKIAEFMKNQLISGQNSVKVCLASLKEKANYTQQELAAFDVIMIGASIRYGHFDPILEQFVQQHAAILNQKLTAFFSVNLTARKADKNTPETNPYTRKFLAKIAWKPTIAKVFAGALLYPRYRFFDRIMIQFIMRITGGETDIRKEVEYTNWQDVMKFVQELQNLCKEISQK